MVNNPDIRGFGFEQISAWISGFYIGNYHPLTMLSYAIDHAIAGQSPFIYHFTSLLLHVGNSILLYLLINQLQPHKVVGLFVALFFALHPSQTESVSWIAERKTVLCLFFYLLALLQYTRYAARPTAKQMIYVCLLGVAAMLSKGLAVSLPVSLFAMDIWLQRDIRNRKVWLEKAPLLLISIVFGVVAIYAQEAGKFLNLHHVENGLYTIVFAAYAYVSYIIHFFLPVGLSVIYPYPRVLGFVEFLYLAIALGILVLGFVAYRKRWYVLCGGILFYTVNIALLLQFVQFGDSLMADRYLYIAGIGIIYPVVYYAYQWFSEGKRKFAGTLAGAVFCGVLLVMTFLRNDIWMRDMNLFSSILEVFPNSVVAQYSVGGLYMREGNYPEAEAHMNMAVRLDPDNYKAWYNKGALHLRQGRPMEALDALNRSLAIDEYVKAYFSRALLYEGTGKYDLALADADRVLEQQPKNARAYYIKADCQEQLGNMAGAMENYNKAIAYEDNEPLFYIRRGMAYAKGNQVAQAMDDLNRAVSLNPNNGEALYYRGIVKYKSGQSPCDDLSNALRHGYKQATEAIAKICK